MAEADQNSNMAALLMRSPRSLSPEDRASVLAEMAAVRHGDASPAFEATLGTNAAAAARMTLFLHEVNTTQRAELDAHSVRLARRLGVDGMVRPAPMSDDLGGITAQALQDHLNDQAVAAAELERAAALLWSDENAGMDLARKHGGSFPAVANAICWAGVELMRSRMQEPRELEVRAAFYRDLSKLLPGAVKIAYSAIPGNIPDGFVAWRGREVPVEIKRTAFDGKALAQLQRYMRVYDAEHGIAVAPALACVLPDNVTFVEVSA